MPDMLDILDEIEDLVCEGALPEGVVDKIREGRRRYFDEQKQAQPKPYVPVYPPYPYIRRYPYWYYPVTPTTTPTISYNTDDLSKCPVSMNLIKITN